MDNKSDPNKGQIKSPAGRTEMMKNLDGMPEELDVKQIFTENTPPKKYADDSTAGLGKPNV